VRSDAPGALGRLQVVPLLPWLAAWPLLALSLVDSVARQQMLGARWPLGLYLLGWLAAGSIATAMWVGAAPRPLSAAGEAASARGGEKSAIVGGWWLAVPLLAFAVASYWNGAVLDPLQFRGFPDYVTQLQGARRLLAGELPYEPGRPVWTDVNLPPLTLLVLFSPFVALSETTGKLAYFALNHLSFLLGTVLLLRFMRPRGSGPSLPIWAGLVLLLAASFEPWHDSVRLGQQNGIVFCLLAVAATALAARHDTLAGVALAAALVGKPSSALLGLYFLLARRWRAALAAAGAGLLLFVVTLPWTGVESWRHYLLEKAPRILAGTPQQSNVALLALHARLFLPADALASFGDMPYLPAAQVLTRVAQALGVVALWRLVRAGRPAHDRLGVYLEFGVTLVLSLSLVGHAWQSYVTWLIVAMVPVIQRDTWAGVNGRPAWWIAGLICASWVALAVNDVALHYAVGPTSIPAAIVASLQNLALLTLAFSLALLLARRDAQVRTHGRPQDAPR
jgi:hypothetical protein